MASLRQNHRETRVAREEISHREGSIRAGTATHDHKLASTAIGFRRYSCCTVVPEAQAILLMALREVLAPTINEADGLLGDAIASIHKDSVNLFVAGFRKRY
jgi:hypothetical protein